MNDPLSVSAVFRSAWHDLRRSWGALVVFAAVFKLLQAWLLVPAVTFTLTLILATAGHVAVSNRDVLDFLLSPLGPPYAGVLGVATLALLLIEQAGILVLADRAGTMATGPALLAALRPSVRVVQLTAFLVGLFALALAPFVGLALLAYRVFLSHDINFYLAERPPAFWAAAGVGGLLLAGAVAVSVWLYVRWAFALPVLVLEGQPALAALRASRDRVRGVGWRVGLTLLAWQLAALLLSVLIAAGFRLLAERVLANAGEQPVGRIVCLLVAEAGLLAGVSFVTVVGHALLTRRLYRQRSEHLGILPAADRPVPEGPPDSAWGRRLDLAAVVLVLAAPLSVWLSFSTGMAAARNPVRVTAHRGHSLAAPENTLSAVRKAIDSGADYAEVDVQLTADGVVVLLHDRDLMRVAGDGRRLDEVSLDDVRKLDVGRWFAPAFAGERVPTLAEVIELARGRVKLNIELKLYGPNQRLPAEVAFLVAEERFESQCLVTSFSLDAVQDVRRLNPRVRTGLIVANALGDVSRLDVDALSVRADWLTDDVVRQAHRRKREVHVWTVNDRTPMLRLMKRGADNLITDDPDLAIRVRDEWMGLTGPERLVLAARLLLGLDP